MRLTYVKDGPPEPWIPKELLGWEWARLALGVLKEPWYNLTCGENFQEKHDEKVLELLRQAPVREKDNPQNLLEDLLPEGWERLSEKASPEKLLEAMKGNASSWQRQRRVLARYLEEELSLDGLKEELGFPDEEYLEPVATSELKKELEELTLREFLELVT